MIYIYNTQIGSKANSAFMQIEHVEVEWCTWVEERSKQKWNKTGSSIVFKIYHTALKFIVSILAWLVISLFLSISLNDFNCVLPPALKAFTNIWRLFIFYGYFILVADNVSGF